MYGTLENNDLLFQWFHHKHDLKKVGSSDNTWWRGCGERGLMQDILGSKVWGLSLIDLRRRQ